MVIFNGKKIAHQLLVNLKKKIKKEKVEPVLAVISVGEDLSSKVFIRNKKRAAKQVGVKIRHYHFNQKIRQEKIVNLIKKLNKDKSINAIIIQLPLPKKFSAAKVIGLISPAKDVDGFNKNSHFQPPLILAILTALKRASSLKELKKKKIVALVNSEIFGQTLKLYLQKEGLRVNYLKRPFNYRLSRLRSADVIITVCGQPGLIKGEMIKAGVILIDGGIIVLPNKQVIGDIDQTGVRKKAQFLTPVPKGLGPLTIAYLLKNVYEASKFSPNY
ncbi:MAG: tetrahydrofolate dehydrogenase/cyclohydrolase catalytic domain-containing protein [Minisyncoccales bacterium]